MALTISINLSASCSARAIGKASTAPRNLKRRALPSITGIAAFGPMFPKPRVLEPSVIIAMRFHLFV